MNYFVYDLIAFLWTLLFFILGALWGSFANVVIVRLPKGKSVIVPRSHCPYCEKTIPWYLNIPIVSWLLLRGKCRFCHAPIAWRYLLVELIMACLFMLVYIAIGWQWLLLEYLVLVFGLITVSFIDLEHMILPDSFTLSGILIGLLGAWLNPERSFSDGLYGMLLGGGFLWLIAYCYWLLRHQEGMGGGDIKLLAWIGAVLGWQAIPFIILCASIIGSIVGLIVAYKQKKGLNVAIPFGPYLAMGAIFYVLLGRSIGDWYLHLFFPAFFV